MGDNLKILFSSMGFMVTGNAKNYFGNRGCGILVNLAIFLIFLRFLTNFTYILTVLAYKIKNGASLIVFWNCHCATVCAANLIKTE